MAALASGAGSGLRKMLSLIAPVLLAASSHAFQTFTAPTGKAYTWDLGATPTGAVEWSVAPGAPAIVREAVQAATEAWSQATGGELRFAEGQNGIAVDWDASGSRIPGPFYLAFATFGVVEDTIISGSIIINASDYEWHRGSPMGVSREANGMRCADLDAVLLHELGHVLGLDHADRNSSLVVGETSLGNMPTMHSVVFPGAETLHADDEAGIRSLYGGAAGSETMAAAIVASASKGIVRGRISFELLNATTQPKWDFGDGLQAVGFAVAHRFAAAGAYTVTATSGGKAATITVEVEKKSRARKPKRTRRR